MCALFLKASMLMLAGSCGWKFGRPRGYCSVEAHPAMRMPRRSEGIAPVRRSAETLLAHRVDFFASAFDLLGRRLTGKSRLRSLRKSEGGVQKSWASARVVSQVDFLLSFFFSLADFVVGWRSRAGCAELRTSDGDDDARLLLFVQACVRWR